jgi:hypothetical protein
MEDFKTPIEDYYKRNGIRDQGRGPEVRGQGLSVN